MWRPWLPSVSFYCPDSWLFQGTLPLPSLEAEKEPEFLNCLDTVLSTEQCWETDPLEATEALRPICCGSLQKPQGGLWTPDSGLGGFMIIALQMPRMHDIWVTWVFTVPAFSEYWPFVSHYAKCFAPYLILPTTQWSSECHLYFTVEEPDMQIHSWSEVHWFWLLLNLFLQPHWFPMTYTFNFRFLPGAPGPVSSDPAGSWGLIFFIHPCSSLMDIVFRETSSCSFLLPGPRAVASFSQSTCSL